MKAPLVLLAALFIASGHQTLSGETSGDWTYSVSDNQATITGYSGVGGAVKIPAVVNETSVVKVGNGLPPIFGDGNTTVTSVSIPNSVTSIGENAFQSCSSLATITIPLTVTSIGDAAFFNCSSLTSITIDAGNSNYSSVDGVFFNKLQTLLIQYPAGILDNSYTIPDSVTSIGNAAFYDCTNLASVTIPDSVTSIGNAAFYDCPNLASVTISDSVTSIGNYAFAACTNLTSVTIPDSVTSIGDYAFAGCTNLTSITIGNSLTSIGINAFNVRSLTSITIDAGNSNFSSVDGVLFNKLQTLLIQYPAGILDNSYTIPDNVTSIGGGAFFNCANLTSITIPDSVTSFGDYAFFDCLSLTSITIPDSVTSIEGYAFGYCTSLASITIPDSVTSIGDSAFYYCTNLTSVTLPILFIDSYPSFSLSSDQVLLYGSSAARDVPLSNNFTAGRASGARTIVNVSARVTLGSGQMVTPGFVVRDVSTKLLIRAVGPRLGDFGVDYLPNPRMTIFDGSQNVVRTIDDWESDNPVSELSDLMTATASAGAFPLEQDTASAATLVTLDPGVYTVQVDSADEGVGDVLVEVYEISE